MASGIQVSPKCIESYKSLESRNYRVIVLKITADMTEVVLENTFGPGTSNVEGDWKEVLATLPENDCRFLVCDFQVNETPTVTKSKLIFVAWSPEYSSIRNKTIYASSKEAVLTSMHVQRSMQATETDELEYSVVKDQVFSK